MYIIDRKIPEVAFRLTFYRLYKSPHRTIICPFRDGWKETAGELAVFPVIDNALTTPSFSRARLIRAYADGFIFFNFAVHNQTPFFASFHNLSHSLAERDGRARRFFFAIFSIY